MGFWARLRLLTAKVVGLEIRHSQDRYAGLLQRSVEGGERWLELGCGRQIVPSWALPLKNQAALAGRARMLVGMDVDAAIREHPLLTYRLMAYASRMPFKDGTFDLITANMVMEHIENPADILVEARRALAPGGRFIFHTPNRRHYLVATAALLPAGLKSKLIRMTEGRADKDVFPTYYRFNTGSRIRALAAAAGFELTELTFQSSVGALRRFGPLAVLEVLIMRLLAVRPLSEFNTTIMGVLSKPADPAPTVAGRGAEAQARGPERC